MNSHCWYSMEPICMISEKIGSTNSSLLALPNISDWECTLGRQLLIQLRYNFITGSYHPELSKVVASWKPAFPSLVVVFGKIGNVKAAVSESHSFRRDKIYKIFKRPNFQTRNFKSSTGDRNEKKLPNLQIPLKIESETVHHMIDYILAIFFHIGIPPVKNAARSDMISAHMGPKNALTSMKALDSFGYFCVCMDGYFAYLAVWLGWFYPSIILWPVRNCPVSGQLTLAAIARLHWSIICCVDYPAGIQILTRWPVRCWGGMIWIPNKGNQFRRKIVNKLLNFRK